MRETRDKPAGLPVLLDVLLVAASAKLSLMRSMGDMCGCSSSLPSAGEPGRGEGGAETGRFISGQSSAGASGERVSFIFLYLSRYSRLLRFCFL